MEHLLIKEPSGILGADAHVWQKHWQKIDVMGIDNHEMMGLCRWWMEQHSSRPNI
jgi:D-arabinose 1-dehydrogenase-like Zn-dependent alcohol dehydrogenase